jgi:hypothetical protein
VLPTKNESLSALHYSNTIIKEEDEDSDALRNSRNSTLFTNTRNNLNVENNHTTTSNNDHQDSHRNGAATSNINKQRFKNAYFNHMKPK